MLNTLESVFVMVDFQGRLAQMVDRSDLVLPKTLQMIEGCQALSVPVLPTLQVPEKLGPMLPELETALEGTQPISKTAFSALREPDFLAALQKTGRKQIILAGIEAHVCVLQTGLDFRDAGYIVHVLSDGVFSRTEENRQLALSRMHDAGAVISSVEMVLFELIQTSKHPSFRTISKIVK